MAKYEGWLVEVDDEGDFFKSYLTSCKKSSNFCLKFKEEVDDDFLTVVFDEMEAVLMAAL